MPAPADRERQAAAYLDAWPWEHGGVIVGGYAVAAYGKPRYSDDIDLVIPVAALEPVHAWLRAQEFQPEKVPSDLEQNYAGKVARWRNGDITVDLLPGVVRDREARIDVPESWVTRDARRMRLVLIDTSTRTAVPVARPEAFLALKLQAGRPQDISDLFAIHEEPADLDEVRQLFERLWCPTLQSKLEKVASLLSDQAIYADSLSRLSLGSPKLAANRRAWERFRERALRALPSGK